MTRTEQLRRRVQNPLIASLLLLATYGVLSLLVDPRGSLGTDTGAKVATLDRMVEDHTSRPAVGYWAESWDPTGDYHPLFDTQQNDDGEWVNVTTLPMLLAARPLYDLGGVRLALLLPMLGAVLAALAARDLARQLGREGDELRAFWVVGLLGPMLIYALDFWEHAPGAGLMLTGIAALARVVTRREVTVAPLFAGLAFGMSATMRTETFAVAVVAVGCSCLFVAANRQFAKALVVGCLAVIGFAGPWLANVRLEELLGGNPRSGRVASAAGSATGSATGSTSAGEGLFADASARAWEAGLTWFGLPGLDRTASIAMGALVAVSLFTALLLLRRSEQRRATLALIAASTVFLVTLIGAGPAFVRGGLMASPIALLGFWLVRSTWTMRWAVAVSVLSALLIWNFQYLGGAGPQWGGRYVLVPTLLLTVIGVIQLRVAPESVGRTLFGLAIVVSVFGVAWVSVRSHRVADFFEAMSARDDAVIISTNGFLVREAGAAYDDRRYLSIGRNGDLTGAVEVARASGAESFAVLAFVPNLPDIGVELVSVERLTFIDAPVWYHRFTVGD